MFGQNASDSKPLLGFGNGFTSKPLFGGPTTTFGGNQDAGSKETGPAEATTTNTDTSNSLFGKHPGIGLS
jgi:hypothetical protein